MIIVFVVMLLIIAALYLMSKGKYNDFTQPLDKKEYKLKDLLPIGLFILDKVKYKYSTGYDRSLLTKVSELKGGMYSHFFLRVHLANKISLVLLIMLMLSFIAAAMGNPDASFLAFSLIVIAIIIYATDKELNDKIRKRKLSIQFDFPDFLNTLILLINAGMTVSNAWTLTVNESKKETPLYIELRTVISDIANGKSEIAAYEDFASRCRISEVIKFISIITQNLKKGNSEIVNMLKYQAFECWEMRKHAARRIGEEATTKMLFPMMFMFLAVILVVATPAVLALTQMK
jgi:tight adherence protein C